MAIILKQRLLFIYIYIYIYSFIKSFLCSAPLTGLYEKKLLFILVSLLYLFDYPPLLSLSIVTCSFHHRSLARRRPTTIYAHCLPSAGIPSCQCLNNCPQLLLLLILRLSIPRSTPSTMMYSCVNYPRGCRGRVNVPGAKCADCMVSHSKPHPST